MNLKAILEVLLFATDHPLSVKELIGLFETNETGEGVPSKKEIEQGLAALQEELQTGERGIELVEINGGFQLRTKPELASWVQRLNESKPTRLSTPAVESLAIIAYRQPITRPEIEAIRGVDSGGVLKNLLERRLIKILGRKEEPGRPLLYGTASEFLELFGLKDLKELPPLKELEEKARTTLQEEGEATPMEEGLAGLHIAPEALEALDQQEREAFGELEKRLSELKESDQKTKEIIAPPEEPSEETDTEERSEV